MVKDIFAAFSATKTVVKTNAESTLGMILGPENFNVSRILLEMMYTGELPMQYYIENISIEKELEHLDQAIAVLRTGIFVNIGINLFLLVIIAFIGTFIFKLKKDFAKAQELEFTVSEGYRKKLKAKKQEIKKEEEERQNRQYGKKVLEALGARKI